VDTQDRGGVGGAERHVQRQVCLRACGEADFGYEGFAQRFAFLDRAGLNDFGDVVPHAGQIGVVGFVGVLVQGEGEFIASLSQLPHLFGDLVDSPRHDVLIDLVVLVVGEVPVDDGLLGGELVLHGCQVGLQTGTVGGLF
jgi:hypothetical protein